MTCGGLEAARFPTLDRFVLGCAQIGGLYAAVDPATATATLQTAWDAGVRHFDTAPHYGAGLSERRLGAFLSQLPRDSFTVSTKVGRLLIDLDENADAAFATCTSDAGFVGGDRKRRVLDYTADGVRRSLEESLVRLGLDRVDTIYIHDPDEHMDEAIGDAYPALHQLRSEGVIRRVGAGMNSASLLTRFVRETDSDTIMLAGRYTLLDREAEQELLPLCVERAVTVVAAGIYNSGLLADPRPGAPYDYTEAPPDLVARALRLKAQCQAHDVPLRAAAIQFPLAHPAVGQVAVGARSPEQVLDNLRMLSCRVPSALWEEIGRDGEVPASGSQ